MKSSNCLMKASARLFKTPVHSLYTPVLVLLLCAAAESARAQSTWTGGGADQNWSTAGNWSGGTVPNNNTVTFPDGAFPVTTNVQGVVNNVVQSSTAISSLTYNNLNPDFDTTQIPSGTTLTISGNLTIGLNDAVSAHATTVTMTGGGSLIAGSGSSTFSGQSGTGNTVSVLDLSGLNTFVFNPAGTGGAFSMGTGGSGSAITVTLAAVSNNITVGTFNLGNNNTRGPNILNLGGGTNIINADTLNLGVSKASGTMQFTAPGGGLTIANHTGTGRATINISGEANTGSTSANNNGTMLLNGGSVNIMASIMTLGNRAARATGSANGILSFDNGIVDATTINMATNLSGGGVANGTVSVGGPGKLIVGNMSLVNEGGSAGTGTLIATNGALVICSNNIYKTTANGVGTVAIDTSSLLMTGIMSTIGVSNGIPIDNFNITNATLTLPVLGPGLPTVTTVNFNPDSTTVSNTINISSLPGVSTYPAQFPLITYTVPGGNLASIVLGTLPAGFSGYISNNAGGLSIDLVLTNGPAAKPDVWTGNVNSLWDTTTLNWTSGGAPTNYLDLDQVTFDDTAHTSAVTVTGTRTPATANGLTFNNSSLDYTFTGSGKISGPAQLVMTGTKSVTLGETGGDNFSGGIMVNAGTLILDDANSAISGGITIAPGATVQIGNNDASGSLPSGALDNEGTLIFDRANNISISTAIPGAGAVAQTGSGTLTLTANNGYTGNTTVGNGTLALTGAGSIASSGQVTVTNATLDVSGVSSTATLNILDMTNAALNVKVGYLQTDLNVSALNMGGTSNAINVQSLPPIAFYPATNVLLSSSSPIAGYNFVLGTLPAGSPAFAGSIALSTDGTQVLLVLTAGPTGTRPSVTWSGADALASLNTNWSDAQNWQSPGVPIAAEPVTFNNTATVGGTPFDVIGDGNGGIINGFEIDNIVDINATNATLTYANNGGTFHNTQINDGKTLTVNGSLAVTGSSGSVTILGTNGSLVIKNPSNATTLNVQNGTAPTLDLSGLGNFAAAVNQLGVGFNSGNTGANVSGNMYLAKTNAITTGSGFSGTGAALEIGSGTGTGQLFLGQSNALYVDGIALGVGASTADVMEFNPTVSNNPVAYIRGILGDSSRVTLWSLGDNTVNLNNTTPGGGHINDFSAGTLNALVNTLVVGQGSQGNNAPAAPVKGTFNMGSGILNVTTLRIGSPGSGNPGGQGVGIMSVSNGMVVADSVGLAVGPFASGTGVSATTGTLSLTNAILVASNGIAVGTNSGGGTLNIVSSTVKLLNEGTIASPFSPLTVLDIDGATLQMDVDGFTSMPDITATTITTNNPTTINIGSISNVTSAIQIPLISYAGNDPYGALILGTHPAGYTVSLVDNVGSSTVDISVTPSSVASTPGISGIRVSGATLTLTATNGPVNGQFTLLGTTNITLPLSQWTPVLTNNFDSSGNLNLTTNIVSPTTPQEFYLLQVLQ